MLTFWQYSRIRLNARFEARTTWSQIRTEIEGKINTRSDCNRKWVDKSKSNTNQNCVFNKIYTQISKKAITKRNTILNSLWCAIIFGKRAENESSLGQFLCLCAYRFIFDMWGFHAIELIYKCLYIRATFFVRIISSIII